MPGHGAQISARAPIKSYVQTAARAWVRAPSHVSSQCQERDGVHWQIIWPLEGRKTASLKFQWPVGIIFFPFHQWELHLS